MKSLSLMGSLLAISITMAPSASVLAHVGHGDEFQSEGGIERVQVNSESDAILGIEVSPIEQASPSGAGVLIPASALVESDGTSLVFVKYENFYEPVPIATGESQGDLIEVTEGLTVGEQLVTQGGLLLYAESRKTQTADNPATSESETASTTDAAPADAAHQKADADGTPHDHDAQGNLVAEPNAKPSSFPMGLAIALGSVAALGLSVLAFVKTNASKQNDSVEKSGVAPSKDD